MDSQKQQYQGLTDHPSCRTESIKQSQNNSAELRGSHSVYFYFPLQALHNGISWLTIENRNIRRSIEDGRYEKPCWSSSVTSWLPTTKSYSIRRQGEQRGKTNHDGSQEDRRLTLGSLPTRDYSCPPNVLSPVSPILLYFGRGAGLTRPSA